MKGSNNKRAAFRCRLDGNIRTLVMRVMNWVTAHTNRSNIFDSPRYWTIGLFLFSAWVLFSNLGVAALIEPDEGRNAEIAREILVLRDWITPHYDFIPRLDKPMLFFDLVALSYSVFGISEWSARLPSALAALGCLLLTYFCSRSWFDRWTARWSALILLTSMEFFAFSRIVIMDMVLTLLVTAALCGFFLGQRCVERGGGKLQFLLMYAALGAATLVKGPIGLLLPAGVIFVYLIFTKRWMLLRHMELPLGLALFFLVAAPWYILAEFRNPGYLQHFVWEENVARFTTSEFQRGGAWYYFIVVLSAGFLPWTALLPTTIADLYKRSLDRERLFLILWIALPMLFFSLSSSKLSHYILPIYPPLAILVGATVARMFTDPSVKTIWVLSFPAVFLLVLSFGLTLVILWPEFLPNPLQVYVRTSAGTSIKLGIGLVVAIIFALIAIRRRMWRRQIFLYPATCFSFALLILCAEPIFLTVSLQRSSKLVAAKAASFIGAKDQVIMYGGYPSSLPFYLNIQQPIWAIWSGTKSKVLGSDYVATMRPKPAAGYGQVLFTNREFAELWKTSKNRLVVFADSGAMNRFAYLIGTQPRIVFQLGDTVLLENRGADRK